MEIKRFLLLLIFLQVFLVFIMCDLKLESSSKNHLRKKRYVVFPEGSVLSAAFCISPTAVTEAGGIFTSGLAWAISYDLPNETAHKMDEVPAMTTLQRHKRDLFIRMEKLIDSAGINGKNCILRTICETNHHLLPRQGVLQEIFRLIFLYPLQTEESYAKAHKAGEIGQDCGALFPCPISLLNLGLQIGKY